MRFFIWTQLAISAYCLVLQSEPAQEACERSEKPGYILNAEEECTIDNAPETRSGIPRKLFITQAFWTEAVARVWERNRARFPDFFSQACVKGFTDKDMACSAQKISLELETENVFGAYEAFKRLRPGAFRADLWRYMILWSEGGMYMDSKMAIEADPRRWINFDSGDSLVIVNGDPCPTFWNGIMAAPAHSEALRDVIAQVIRNVQGRNYKNGTCGISNLFITGPGALADGLQATHDNWKSGDWSEEATRKQVSVPMVIEPLPWGTPTTIKYTPDDLIVAKCDISGNAHDCVRGGAPHYSKLWNLHQVYCDEPGPLCDNECHRD